jgi:hypothetical protein
MSKRAVSNRRKVKSSLKSKLSKVSTPGLEEIIGTIRNTECAPCIKEFRELAALMVGRGINRPNPPCKRCEEYDKICAAGDIIADRFDNGQS